MITMVAFPTRLPNKIMPKQDKGIEIASLAMRESVCKSKVNDL